MNNVENNHPQELPPSPMMMMMTTTTTQPQWVVVTAGKHKGKRVCFVKQTAQRIAVALPKNSSNNNDNNDDGKEQKIVYLLPHHVDMNPTTTTTTIPPPPALRKNAWVRISAGKHKGKVLRFIQNTAQRIAVQLPENGKVIYLDPHHVQPCTSETPVASPPRPVTPNVVQVCNNNNNNNHHTTIVVDAIPPGQVEHVRQDQDKEESSYGFVSAVETVQTQVQQQQQHHAFVSRGGSSSSSRCRSKSSTSSSRQVLEQKDEEDEDIDFPAQDNDHQHNRNDDETDSFATAIQDPFSLAMPGDLFPIYSGKHVGRMAIFLRRTPERIAIQLQGESTVRYLSPKNFVHDNHDDDDYDSTGTNTDLFVSAMRESLPRLVRVANVTAAKSAHTLFGVLFPNEHDAVFLDVGNLETLDRLPLQFNTVSNDSAQPTTTTTTYCLAAVKVHDKAKALTCAYLRAPHQGDVANRLLTTVGALHQLVPRKVAARLELVLSTASFPIQQQLQASDFDHIPERSNVGCGFIPRIMIDKLVPSLSRRENVCALQVRIAIPSMGLFKGMLMEKPGIDKIQLPPSMQKVQAATQHCDTGTTQDTSTAWLMVNQAGTFPYATRMQQAADNFQLARPIPNMAQWTLAQKGVSQSYLKQPNRQHSNLVGVADPTDSIPAECIFLTGILGHLNEFSREHVLVSRFPMTEAADARKLRILKERPISMTVQDWDFLCSKPFGLVVFGNSAPGDRSMPEQISQGDLDGDGYFVCWDPYVIDNAVIGDAPFFASKNHSGTPSSDWWTASLEFMANIQERRQSQQLVGRLHDGWLRKLRGNSQQDALAYGRAYKDALAVTKHGGKVNLPQRLCLEVPSDLRHYLNPI